MFSSSQSRQSLDFPQAQQAQIIRANQRDLYHVSSLKEHAESVLRSWLGTRWLQRWDKELDMVIKLVYYGLTTGRATQTLGEEYTDIWQYDSRRGRFPASLPWRANLIALSVLPPYLLAKISSNARLASERPAMVSWLKKLSKVFSIASEVNLALFYLRGSYYDPVKRLLQMRNLSSLPENPHTRPPSYSLLGIMIGVRLLYRLVEAMRPSADTKPKDVTAGSDSFIDDRSVETVIRMQNLDELPLKEAEDDDGTALDVASIPSEARHSRNCTLCLGERTDSCVTECGHLFCWNCIVGWGREKAECPLCRQALSLSKLLPIHNL
ncbi:peroxisome assembly protein per8 [Coprinopsis sp. MPI-PUGE-AT-0042]|nr:peroxisome assembly protein per8 [Coprinopsis sp. MPI-PUGE-AT-0042]